ncbi:MAG TPA: gamma-glutamyltransferase [Diaminobutyricibacter sp.]
MSPFTQPDAFTTRPTLEGTFGMAASTHWLASQSAQAVLERGGNAFDAAVAGAFVLHVVEPHLNGPGGDLVAIVAPSGEEPRVLMGQGPAPAGASAAAYRELGLGLVPGSGFLAAAVPGSVDAWMLLLKDRGTWELADVWEYAIGYARDGHPVAPAVVKTIGAVAGLFRTEWTSSADQWLVDGAAPVAGSIVRNEAWAHTLERLIAAGGAAATREDRIDAARDAWAGALVAQQVEQFVSDPALDSSGARHSGVIAASDFAAFRAAWERPVSGTFRGRTVLKAGAWSQGPAFLQALAILDGFADDELDPSTAGGVHRIVEAQKLAFADRDAYYGDGVDVPIDHLLSEEYAAERRALISSVASSQLRPGSVPGYGDRSLGEHPVVGATDAASASEATVAAAASGEPTLGVRGEARGDTCHIDVVDRWGNMIAATPSGGWLQSSPYIPSVGFALGTRLQMTRLEPGLPTTLTPGRRPRTTLTPTVLVQDGRPYAAFGSPGGDQQEQWQLPFLIRHVLGGYSLQAAIDAPSFHTTSLVSSFWPRDWEPAGLVVEDRLGDDVIEELRRLGHRVDVVGGWTLGRLSAVSWSGGIVRAAANPRGMQGYAVGR